MKNHFMQLWLTAALILVASQSVFSQNVTGIDLGTMVKPVGADAVFSEKDYFVWCGSMVKGSDNKYHLFYSRWQKKLGFYAWVTNSEIAHAVAGQPNGPYKFVNVVLPARNKKYWDGAATHNPTILFKAGKYYLYYMGTTGTASVGYPASMKDTAWWEYRNHQRIGLAVASRPDGHWRRLDTPVLGVGEKDGGLDRLMTSNPAATFGKDGKVVLVYKQVEDNHTMKGGKVRFGVAFSASPSGPFKKEKQPVFEMKSGETDWMVAEDPFIWYQNKYYLAIVRDVIGKYTGQKGSLALLVSRDAKDWKPAVHPTVLASRFKWANGKDSDNQLERPQLYLENGIPKILFGATECPKENTTVNVRIPLQ